MVCLFSPGVLITVGWEVIELGYGASDIDETTGEVGCVDIVVFRSSAQTLPKRRRSRVIFMTTGMSRSQDLRCGSWRNGTYKKPGGGGG